MTTKYLMTKGTTNFRVGPSTNDHVIENVKGGTIFAVLKESVDGTTFDYAMNIYTGKFGFVTNLDKYVSVYTPTVDNRIAAILNYGRTYLGSPYVFGSKRGDGKDFDCSEFTQWTAAIGNVTLGGNSRLQASNGKASSLKALKIGDIILFDTDGDGVINHVAWYAGNNKLLHTYKKGIGVIEMDYTSYWQGKAVQARTVVL